MSGVFLSALCCPAEGSILVCETRGSLVLTLLYLHGLGILTIVDNEEILSANIAGFGREDLSPDHTTCSHLLRFCETKPLGIDKRLKVTVITPS